MEIHLKSRQNFNEISMEILMKYQWKSIGNPVEISMKYQWKSIGNPVEILMKYQLKPIGNPVEISMNTNGNTLKIQLKFQCNIN